MSRYLYYNGEIYNRQKHFNEENDKFVLVCDNRYEVICYKSKDYHYILFDNFEYLIEVGDIIEFAVDIDYYVKSEVLDFQVIGEDDRKVINVFLDKINYQCVKSIWKRLDNTFIRVCHKDNESWVID